VSQPILSREGIIIRDEDTRLVRLLLIDGLTTLKVKGGVLSLVYFPESPVIEGQAERGVNNTYHCAVPILEGGRKSPISLHSEASGSRGISR